MTGPEYGLVACRFLNDLAVMLLWGSSAFLAAAVPRDLAAAIERRLGAIAVAALATALLTTTAMVPIEVAAIGGGWTDAFDLPTVEAVLFETDIGGALLVRIALAVLLAVAAAAPVRWRVPATAAASGLLLLSLALQGHAVMDPGALGIVHRATDAVHVLSAGAWFGALAPVLLAIAALDEPPLRASAGLALRRFSRAGHVVVALVLATGAANTALVLKGWPSAPWSPYRLLLCAKILAVAGMTGLAVLNRYVALPRLTGNRRWTLRALRGGTIGEIALGTAAIACVGLFGLLEPR